MGKTYIYINHMCQHENVFIFITIEYWKQHKYELKMQQQKGGEYFRIKKKLHETSQV